MASNYGVFYSWNWTHTSAKSKRALDMRTTMAPISRGNKNIIRLSDWENCPGPITVDGEAIFIDDRGHSMDYNILLSTNAHLDFFFVADTSHLADFSRAIDFDLRGENAQLAAQFLVLSQKNQQQHFRIRQVHWAPSTESTVLLKGVIRDRASVVIDDTILVEPTANFAQAHFKNHNLVLSDCAQIRTTPTLEIFAKDVECSHGATAGGLDDRQLFYLNSRGIPNEMAEEILAEGFTQEITEALRLKLK